MKENQQAVNSSDLQNAASYLGIERLIISVIFNLVFGLAVFVGLNATGLPMIVVLLVAGLFVLSGILLLTKQLPAELIGLRKRKPLLCTSWLLISLTSIVFIARLSVFMIDPSQIQYSLFPGDKWMVEHCCLTAYSESARIASTGEKNIYLPELYFGEGFIKDKSFRQKLDGFNVDQYHYPPPFLLLPFMSRVVVAGDFLDLRMLWFSLSVLSLLAAIAFIIYRLETQGRLRMIGMTPLIFSSLPVLAGLQMSNVQIIIIAISIIAMTFFTINRPIGGMFLAMSSVAKIFPGILFVYLIVSKKFREAGWVVGFVILLTVITFSVFGFNPFKAFIEYEIPRISSGEAFSNGPFSRAFAVARNMSPFGLPLKLGWLGVPGMTLEIGRIVSSIHLLMVLILAIWSGRQKPRSNTEAISVWISLITLGSLVSPFAPANYVLVSLVIVVCLNREVFSVWMVILILLLIGAPFFISREATFLIQTLSFLPSQIFAIVIPAFILYRAGLKTIEDQKVISKAYVAPEVSID